MTLNIKQGAAPFRLIQVYADWLVKGFSLSAYTDGKRWNGWAMPYFTFDAGMALVDEIRRVNEADAGRLPALTYDEAKDTFVVKLIPHPEGDDEEFYDALSIEVDGELVKVYPIGTAGWCWSEVGT